LPEGREIERGGQENHVSQTIIIDERKFDTLYRILKSLTSLDDDTNRRSAERKAITLTQVFHECHQIETTTRKVHLI